MSTITGSNWTLDYIIKGGKVIGTKFRGKCSGIKEAFKMLELILAKEIANAA